MTPDTVPVHPVTVDTVRLAQPTGEDRVALPYGPAVPHEPGAPPARPAVANRGVAGRPSRAGRVVLAAVAGALTVSVATLAFLLMPDDDDPADRSGSEVTTVQGDDGAGSAGNRAGPTGDGAEPAADKPAAVAPLAPDAPSDGLGLGSVGRAGLSEVEPAKDGTGGQSLARFFGSVVNREGGYAVGVPQAFDAWTDGPVTFVEFDPTMFRSGFEVRSYRDVDPWTRLRQDERQFAREHQGDGYDQEKLTRNWTYRGQDAVAWEFTWTLNGTEMHGQEVAFRVGSRTYTVLYRSADLWWLGGGSHKWPEGFERSFQPLP